MSGAEREPVVVGLIVADAEHGLAHSVADRLPGDLEARVPGVEWRAEVREAPAAEPSADSRELLDAVRRRMLDEGWELAVGLTELPLRAGHRPVRAQASATHGVGLVSLPALGALGLERRLSEAVVHLVEGLLGESVDRAENEDDGERRRRMASRARELASPLGRVRVHNDGTVRFVGATLRGNLRLLVGMVRASRPARVIVGLSSALVGALGTGAYAMTSSSVWQLSYGLTWPRLVAISLLAAVGTWIALVVTHGLWERADGQARERVVVFNLATAATVAIGVLTLYAGLFAATLACGAVLIPPSLLEDALGHPVGVPEYLKLATLAAVIATLGGALGSMVESDIEVRNAAHRFREDARSERPASTSSG